MHQMAWRGLLFMTAAMACGTLQAQSCARVAPGEGLNSWDSNQAVLSANVQPAPQGAVKLVVRSDGVLAAGASVAEQPVVAGQPVTAMSAFFAAAKAQVQGQAAPARAKAVLQFLDGTGTVVGSPQKFYLDPDEADADKRNSACSFAPKPIASSVASAKECESLLATLPQQPYQSYVLFNSKGAVCYAPYPLRQRDKLRFLMVWKKGEMRQDGVSAAVANCTVATAAPSILSSGDLPAGLIRQSLNENKAPFGTEVQLPLEYSEVTPPIECESGAPKITLTIPQDASSSSTREHVLTLFGRYNAVFHVGVLGSKAHEPDYQLRTLAGQTTITNREAEQRGPEYVAMVVLQALPKSLSLLGGTPYPGRDPVHDNSFSDRLGLALSFGLKDPRNRFGIGPSYELARGVNVVAVYEWVKQTRLNGVSVGDSFAGTAAEIPTRKVWAKQWSVGLTFDIDYITKVFGAAGK
jgi:hypothetical protein